MATKPYSIDAYTGLNLASDPTEVGATGAVDLLNADLSSPGRVSARPGYAALISAFGGAVRSLAFTESSADFYLVLGWHDGSGGTYFAANASTGSVLSTQAGSLSDAPMWTTGHVTSYATYAPAGHIMKFGASGGVYTWTDTDISGSVAIADTWKIITRTPVSDRLVLANGTATGVANAKDRVVFSDPGAATFTAANWVALAPNEGHYITAAGVYRELTIVFKESKFAVFTAESTASDGTPVFNYRWVDTGIGCVGRFAVAPAPEGLYFVSRDGVYTTQGGAPVKVSAALDPLFRGTSLGGYAGSAIAQPYLWQARCAVYQNRLFVAVTTGANTENDTLLVYDSSNQSWTVWNIVSAALCGQVPLAMQGLIGVITYPEGLLIARPSTKDVVRLSSASTTDAGTGIAWSYTSGKYSPAEGQVAIGLESQLVGSGTVSLEMATSGGSGSSSGAFDTAGSMTLGTSPALAEGWRQRDFEGAIWQHRLSGTGPATVARLTHFVNFIKPNGSW